MSAPRFVLRDAGEADLLAVVELNNSAVPNVNRIELDELEKIAALSNWFRVAEDAQGIIGVVMCMASGGTYWSGNYAWFTERYPSFLYLDRVVVAERARGMGVGAAMYAEMHAFAAARWPVVGLEVNLRPPNEGSDRFHQRLGYRAVGVREYSAEGNAVTMYIRATG